MKFYRSVLLICLAMALATVAGCNANASQQSFTGSAAGRPGTEMVDPTIPAVVITGKRMGRLEKLIANVMESVDL